MITENMKALYIIVNAGFAEEAMAIARECGVSGGTIMNARGSGAHLTAIMGANVEPEKEIIVSVVESEIAEKAMLQIKEKAGIKSAANGICFSTPVDAMTTINKFPPKI